MEKHLKHTIRKSVSGRIFDIFNYAFILFFCALILFPIWEMLVVSLSRPDVVTKLSINFWPKAATFDAYRYCLRDISILIAYRNSILRTLLGSVFHLLLCSMAAFSLTRTNMPGYKLLIVVFLIPMFFSGGQIPTYLNIRNLGLIDNFLVYILPLGFSTYNTIIIRNYFFSIDRSLEEAASIDGASAWQVLYKVILPLSKPVLATVAMWQLVGQWNSWYDNMVYCRANTLVTLQYLLKRLTSQTQELQHNMNTYVEGFGTNIQIASETVIAATTVIVMVPIICTYPFLQKYFVKGVMLGAVKG